jgi:DtxR family transcriptional regulator, Mn-dependent transcriptional regulator
MLIRSGGVPVSLLARGERSMPEDTPGLSRSVEDYLKAIYALSELGDAASTSSIAQALDVQPASVTGMIKRLAESGYLTHVPYRGVRLTEAGTREALRILRRHRIIETYLTERLGYAWEEVHPEAERLEHAASDQLIERMASALEHPSHDPHGAPIPTSTGEIEPTDPLTLSELAPGQEAQVRAVRDDDMEGLLAVEAAGLIPGARVRVVGRTRIPSAVKVKVQGLPGPELEVPMEVARRVFVVFLPTVDEGLGGPS